MLLVQHTRNRSGQWNNALQFSVGAILPSATWGDNLCGIVSIRPEENTGTVLSIGKCDRTYPLGTIRNHTPENKWNIPMSVVVGTHKYYKMSSSRIDSMSQNLTWWVLPLPESYQRCNDNHDFVPATSNKGIKGGKKETAWRLGFTFSSLARAQSGVYFIVGQCVHTH